MEYHNDNASIKLPNNLSMNNEQCTYNERDDENSNKSLLHEFLLDSNKDHEQSLYSSDESNKNLKYENDNTVQRVKYKRSKRYELQASYMDKKENFDKYAVTSSESEDDTELRQSLNESVDDYYIKSDNNDESKEFLSDTNYANTPKREKRNLFKRYSTRSTHSYKKYKFNKNNVTSDSQDNDDSDQKQFTHDSDNDEDDTMDYIKSRDNKKSVTREKRKFLNRYKLQRSHSQDDNSYHKQLSHESDNVDDTMDYIKSRDNKKSATRENRNSHTDKNDNAKKYGDATKYVQDIENNKEISQVPQSDKNYCANKYPNNTKSVQEHKQLANENNKKEQHDDSDDDDDKSLYDSIKMEKLKTSQRYELQKNNLDNMDKSSINAKFSKSDNVNEHIPSPYKSNQELQHKRHNSNNENSINPENFKKSQNTNDALDNDDYFSQNQTSNDSRKSDNSYADMNLDERMDILKACCRSNNLELAAIFNLSRQQLKDITANSDNIIQEYKQKYPDFNKNDLKIASNRICNTLTLDERIEVLKVYDRSSHYNHNQLATIFDCSEHQIKYTLSNRMRFINEYKMQPRAFDKNDSLKSAVFETLNWNECIDVIKVYYRTRYSNTKLAVMFNCSPAEVQNILKNRKQFIKEYKKDPAIANLNTLSLKDGIEVLRDYDSNHYSCEKLATMFNCSMANIESTLANRNALIEKYKKQHPDFNENELENSNSIFCDHPLSLNKCIDVIKAYYSHLYPYYKLSRMFKCSIGQIQHILTNRDSIIKEFKRIHPEFDEIELKSNKSLVNSSGSSSNSLGLDDRRDVIRFYNHQYSYDKIASIFNCSIKEILNIVENPNTAITDYKLEHPDFDIKTFKTNLKLYGFTLSLDERIKVIRAHIQHKLSYYKLASMFKCLISDIKYTLDNREVFIKKYKELHPNFDEHKLRMKPPKQITLNERIAVLKAHDRYHYPYYKLAAMFKCSIGQIEMTVDNRDLFTEKYKKSVENDMAASRDEDPDKEKSNSVNKPTIERFIEVISTFSHERDYTKLSRLFNFSVAQIKTIIQNRARIMARYKMSKNNNISDKDNPARQHENKDIRKNLNVFTPKTAVPKIETQPESTDDVNDVYQESYEIYFNTDNPKLLDNDQNDKDDDSDDDGDGDEDNYDTIDLTNEKTLRWWSKQHMRIYLQVIKAYDEINSYSVVARRFKCSWLLVYNIIENRIAILKALGRPISVKLTFLQRIDVLRDYKSKQYTYNTLTQIYNCKLSEIVKCIQDRASYKQIYKKLYPQKSKSKHKPRTIRNKILSLKIQKEIIKFFDQYPNEMLLSRLYNCSLQLIFEIINNRNEVLNKNTSCSTDTLENLSISCHQDIGLALKPLSNYAELVGNTTAINIMSQLEEHLIGFKTNLPKSYYQIPKNVEFCSYLDALKALKPIEVYTYSSTNYKAKDAMKELAIYLKGKCINKYL